MVPQDILDARIMTSYKNKDSRPDCNNYRKISLLAIAEKAFVRKIIPLFKKLAERVYPEF